ncbi:hypothetical protein SAPIO_CDS9915 [Scedosporium apiospermum]|uniref:SSCRP protein n=1 Tax=Pseudallescheria apiosperma TaxID=563466 RepID=A0A084FVY2_PSEDA|nr:uncharacterized protein SAPIO_CDS9915 [Scedosporium apiospermum]KEZ39244.1 hypothetical protein SAPIO_CDS9915 [Scedosporium apiospermum]
MFLSSALTLLTLASTAFAHPSLTPRDAQTVHLTFHGGPASYSMEFAADGVVHQTNNDIAVSIIDAPDYFAQSNCHFVTDGPVAFVSSISPQGVQQLLVGPPQPIRSVSCSGVCLPTYSDCYINGQPQGTCCAGYCAANKCRPWVNPYA